jgi:hypothetical protein
MWRDSGRASEARQKWFSGVSWIGDGNPKGLDSLTGARIPAEWPWPDDLDAMVAAPGLSEEFRTLTAEMKDRHKSHPPE